MDTIVHAALEEICSRQVAGLPLPELWSKLQPALSSHGFTLSPKFKQLLWTNLLDIPNLQFKSHGGAYGPRDDYIRSVGDSERLNLRIVAPEHLRDSFVGVYDVHASDAKLNPNQRRILELLAIARGNGITQSELAKELRIRGNDVFYLLKKLESRGIITRQSTVVRTKETSNEEESKTASVVTTNMVHLYRYAKHLGCHQRLEITKGDKSFIGIDCFSEESTKEDVQIRDFLPALKAICDKLEKAEGKVLLVSDIKRDLGYKGTSGHRSWRNICHRLKEARLVEEFLAKVDGSKVSDKEVNCLRLLKEFSPKHFEPKSRARECDDLDPEQPPKLAKRGQITDQLVELPIEHQIYDMIDAEGSRGLKIIEASRRLGISSKQYYNRFLDAFTRHGMHLQPERPDRGLLYRVRTSGYCLAEASNITSINPEEVLKGNSGSNSHIMGLEAEDLNPSVSNGCFKDAGKIDITELEHEGPSHVMLDGEDSTTLVSLSKPLNSDPETSYTVHDAELQIVNTNSLDVTPDETSPFAGSTPSRRRDRRKYPRLTLVADSAQREQRILKMLQEEKFLIKPDLHRRLESLQNGMMDRKTLERCLNKLQREGYCKCIHVSVPVITNCGRSRTTEVVLHPSVYSISPEVLGQIHEKMRSFETQIRSQSRLKKGQSIPKLNDIQRIPKDVKLDSQAEQVEVMRTNGYVMAKMVRAKLFHIHLWGYISSSPGCDNILSSCKHGYDMKNPHSTCKLIDLDAAIKAMPLELFLQIVGSTQKFEDMIEKCRKGLCLFDLPPQEYRCVMDMRATGRLSWLIDMLRRLKLIRLVRGDKTEDVTDTYQTTLTYSLELKPYIEEPVSIPKSSIGFFSYDLRPQIRHDFVLSSRRVVDEYWKTLEYCYAATNPEAALHAFPGSAVHEVFLSRSWASVRVMTADQRAKLLERIFSDCSNRKLSFKECDMIAKDLNLTLEQVLRVSYDKRKRHRDRSQGVSEQVESQPLKSTHTSSSRKRRRSSRAKSTKYGVDGADFGENPRRLPQMPDVDRDQLNEAHDSSLASMNNSCDLWTDQSGDCIGSTEELESNEQNDDDDSFIRKCALSKLKATRKMKFSWTESADRQLVVAYVKCRAALGANFHRVDWASLPNLPAPPDSCKRRMAVLNSSPEFRKAVMRLSNVLSERYMKHLQKFQDESTNNVGGKMIFREYALAEGSNRDTHDGSKHTTEFVFDEQWDNFDDDNVKAALSDALRLKKKAKLEGSKEVEPLDDKCTDVNSDSEELFPHGQDTGNHARRSKASSRKSCSNRIAQKFVKPLNGQITVSKRAYESVAIANALELFKLIFLNSSKSPMVPSLLAETLRRYSEHDLFSAFEYLREKKIMIGGSAGSPFVLSQNFLHCISSSPFPINTGKRAAKFAGLLCESEKDLMAEGLTLTADLQCGDIFHICALIASGKLSITPCLPDEGVGEAEDSRSSKRKSNNSEFFYEERSKKLRTSLAGEGEIISRRAKGFPGISLWLRQATISRFEALESFKDVNSAFTLFSEEQQIGMALGVKVDSISSKSDEWNHKEGDPDCETLHHSALLSTESPWEAMKSFAEHVWSSGSGLLENNVFHSELFRDVYSAIQKAGDQGLSMKEISMIANLQGEKMTETLVRVLEAFGRVLKVNAYDSIHVVDSLYQSKYFLTTSTAAMPISGNSEEAIGDNLLIHSTDNHENDVSLQNETSVNSSEVHRVTILNLREEVAGPLNETETIGNAEGVLHLGVITSTRNHGDAILEGHSIGSQTHRTILPWINGDGTINELVYKGLVRRVLGVLMQNPGILEDDIISKMHVLNPQSCRSLLKTMVLDNHIMVRKMAQKTSSAPPTILSGLLGSQFKKPKLILREHFFANPTSTTLL